MLNMFAESYRALNTRKASGAELLHPAALQRDCLRWLLWSVKPAAAAAAANTQLCVHVRASRNIT